MKRLPRTFYERSGRVVAIELLGKVLVVPYGKRQLKVKIVETEAYYGSHDPASHAFRGKTPRNAVMFGPAGFTYVYFIYGNHYCLNIVTEREHVAGAVLIRAVEPLQGLAAMMRRRTVKNWEHIGNGPGKLTQALGITKKHSGRDLVTGDIFITDGQSSHQPLAIEATPRIGIKRGKHLMYRFYIKDNKYVSKK